MLGVAGQQCCVRLQGGEGPFSLSGNVVLRLRTLSGKFKVHLKEQHLPDAINK